MGETQNSMSNSRLRLMFPTSLDLGNQHELSIHVSTGNQYQIFFNKLPTKQNKQKHLRMRITKVLYFKETERN